MINALSMRFDLDTSSIEQYYCKNFPESVRFYKILVKLFKLAKLKFTQGENLSDFIFKDTDITKARAVLEKLNFKLQNAHDDHLFHNADFIAEIRNNSVILYTRDKIDKVNFKESAEYLCCKLLKHGVYGSYGSTRLKFESDADFSKASSLLLKNLKSFKVDYGEGNSWLAVHRNIYYHIVENDSARTMEAYSCISEFLLKPSAIKFDI